MENVASRVATLVRAFIYNPRPGVKKKRAEIDKKPECYQNLCDKIAPCNPYPNPATTVYKRKIIMESCDLSSVHMVNLTQKLTLSFANFLQFMIMHLGYLVVKTLDRFEIINNNQICLYVWNTFSK